MRAPTAGVTRVTALSGRAALAVAVAAGTAGVGLAAWTARPGGILAHRVELLVEIGLWWVVFVVGAAAVLRAPRRAAVVLVLVLAVVTRVAALSAKAPLSDDLYRYAWDGRVQAAGIDPYRYPPLDPALAGLREGAWYWPDPVCAPPTDGPCTWINRPAARTIYPPVAEGWFFLLHALGVDRAEDRGYEAVALGVDLAVLGLLGWLLRARRRDPRWLVFYGWCPLPILETAQNAHVDGLAVLFTLLAVAAAARRPLVASAGLALAGLIKLYPFALAPALLRRRPWQGAAVLAGITVAAYLPHVLAVGPNVLGYLPSYLAEERYDAGSRYQLLAPLHLPPSVATAIVGLVFAAVVVRVWRRDPRHLAEPEWDALLVFGVLLLLVTPVQPWYALTLVALATLTGRPEWLAVGAAGYPLYFALVLDGPAQWVGPLAYGLAAAVVLGASWSRRRSRPRLDLPVPVEARTTTARTAPRGG